MDKWCILYFREIKYEVVNSHRTSILKRILADNLISFNDIRYFLWEYLSVRLLFVVD